MDLGISPDYGLILLSIIILSYLSLPGIILGIFFTIRELIKGTALVYLGFLAILVFDELNPRRLGDIPPLLAAFLIALTPGFLMGSIIGGRVKIIEKIRFNNRFGKKYIPLIATISWILAIVFSFSIWVKPIL